MPCVVRGIAQLRCSNIWINQNNLNICHDAGSTLPISVAKTIRQCLSVEYRVIVICKIENKNNAFEIQFYFCTHGTHRNYCR